VIEYHEASPSELESWDERTVAPAGGHVLQSRPWAEYQARTGWLPTFLVGSDGSAMLALQRSWRLGGASAYISRGPIPNGTVDELVDRLTGAAAWLGANGAGVIASDAEVAAWTGYPERIAAAGFRPIEEIEPSRHRLVVRLGERTDEEAVFGNVAKGTRQRILQAERQDLRIVRYDATIERDDVGPGFIAREDPPELAIARLHGLLGQHGKGRTGSAGRRSSFVDWCWSAYRPGYLVLLEARDQGGAVVAGLALYRHGGRLSAAFSGADGDAGDRQRPASTLLRWRAMQLAIRDGCTEMDLGGVDVAGARHEPQPGEPLHGPYQEARSFGAEWLELTGAHQRVGRPKLLLANPITARVLQPDWPVQPAGIESAAD
jgi:Acetyltransferase (GNAT) domain